jgi:glyoxylase-like metal-dependent hydrolase (beta-lactamase superfamily II)
MAYCTGRCMADPGVGGVFDAAAVTAMIDKVFAGRVQFHDGDDEIAPGISLHKVGGHTRGMQIVRVATARGWVVLGSDTAHFYANLEPGRPFPILDDLPAYIEAQRTALRLASSPQHFIPGHDPLVLARYPSARAGLEGVARLDLAPQTGGTIT